MDILHKIKILLKEKKINYEEFAKKINVSKPTVVNYFAGRSKIDIDTIQKIAEVLEVDISYFFGNENKPTNLEQYKNSEPYKLVKYLNTNKLLNKIDLYDSLKESTIEMNIEKRFVRYYLIQFFTLLHKLDLINENKFYNYINKITNEFAHDDTLSEDEIYKYVHTLLTENNTKIY